MALTKVSTGMLEAGAASVDLNLDDGTLYIDVANGRVGVGTTTPSTSFEVSGDTTLASGTVTGALSTNTLSVSSTATVDTLTVSTTATVPYDNTISGLTATNVQSAITELNTLLGGGNVGSQATWNIYEFTTTANQTQFDISTQGSPAPSYVPGYVQVYLNGILLGENDYTAVDGTTINFSPGIANAGQLLSVVVLDSFNTAELLRVTSIDASASTNSISIDSTDKVTLSSLSVDAASGVGGSVFMRGGTYTDIAFATGFRFEQPAGTTNANRQFKFTSEGTSLSIQGIDGSGTTQTDTKILLNPEGGNVGIGTTSPSYPLQVRRAGGAGSLGISIDNVGSTDRTVQYFSIQDSATGAGAGHAFYYRPQGSTTDTFGFMLDESGNVGIGTDIPSSALHISGDYLSNKSDIQLTNTNSGRSWRIGDGIGAITSKLVFFDATASASRMVIDSSGQVGIGTDNPDRLLNVVGTDTIVAEFENTSATGNARIYVTSGTAAAILGQYGESHATLPNVTQLSSPSETRFINSGVTVATMKSTGNVGIGTTDPSERLSIYKGITYNTDSALFTTIEINSDAVDNNAVYRWRTGITGNATGHSYTFSTQARLEGSYVERMRIDSSGNLLVGKTATNIATDGVQLFNDGFIHATATQAVANSGTVASIRRSSTDGSLVDFYKDGTTVGSIASRAGVVTSVILNPSASIGAGITEANTGDGPSISPTDGSGAISDAAIDLGTSSIRWQDLYLSGQAKIVTGREMVMGVSGSLTSKGDTGGWSMGHLFYGSLGTYHGGFGALGNVDDITYYWIGPEYNDSNSFLVYPTGNAVIRNFTPTGATGSPAGTSLEINSSSNNYINFRNQSDDGSYAGLTFTDNNTAGYIVFRNFFTGGTAAADETDCLIFGTYQDFVWQTGVSQTINGKTERMRLTQGGNLVFPNGGGIDFNAVQSSAAGTTPTASATLDDYEEGAWTPTLKGSTGNPSGITWSGGSPKGRYTKIGRTVHIEMEIFASAITTDGTGGFSVGGLPFDISTEGSWTGLFVSFGEPNVERLVSAATNVQALGVAGTDTFRLYKNNLGTAGMDQLLWSTDIASEVRIRLTGAYSADT